MTGKTGSRFSGAVSAMGNGWQVLKTFIRVSSGKSVLSGMTVTWKNSWKNTESRIWPKSISGKPVLAETGKGERQMVGLGKCH